MDDDVLEYVYNLLTCLSGIAPTYYIYGNHDFMAKNVDQKSDWYEFNNFDYITILNSVDNFYLLNDKSAFLPENIEISGIYFPFSYYEIDKENNDDYINLFKEKVRNGFLSEFDTNKFNILMQHSPNNIFDRTSYLNLLKILKQEIGLDVYFDFILSGHLHNGLIPNYISKFVPGNRGLIGLNGPDVVWFADNCRGFKQITDTTAGIILPAVSTFGTTTFGENFSKKLNTFYPIKVHSLTLKR